MSAVPFTSSLSWVVIFQMAVNQWGCLSPFWFKIIMSGNCPPACLLSCHQNEIKRRGQIIIHLEWSSVIMKLMFAFTNCWWKWLILKTHGWLPPPRIQYPNLEGYFHNHEFRTQDLRIYVLLIFFLFNPNVHGKPHRT